MKVYENKTAYPRAWLTHQTDVNHPKDAVFARMDKPGIDLHNVALLQSPSPSPFARSGTTGDRRALPILARRRHVARSQHRRRRLLVIGEVWYPGWRATVNGQTVEIRKTDGALRGIMVPRGASHIVLEYVPFTFYVGIGLGLLTLACIAAGWLILRRKSRAT